MIPADVLPGTDYKIRISSCFNPSISDASDADFIILPSDISTPGITESPVSTNVTGSGEVTLTDLKLYPNPATDRINIQSAGTISKVTLMNSLGHPVLTALPHSPKLTLSLAGFNSGIYFISVESEGTVTTQKIVVK
jgi:hypothetical protein